MFKFFDMISSFLGTIVDAIAFAVSIIVYLFGSIGTGLTYIVTCLAYMPNFISGFCIVLVSLAVVFTVLHYIRG